MSRPRETQTDTRDIVRRGMRERWSREEIAAACGCSVTTVARHIADIKDEWRQNAAALDEEFSNSLAAYTEIESEAWRRGQLRTALEARNARVRLLGIARPEKQAVSVSGGVAINVRYLTPTDRLEDGNGGAEERADG